jgi:glutamate-1-semialdehyde 2,1-aminomutase
MAAGIAQLTECAKPGFYAELEKRTVDFITPINAHAKANNYAFEIHTIGSIFWLSFAGNKTIRRADDIDPDMTGFRHLHHALLEVGVYLGPSGYEVGFVSQAHTPEILVEVSVKFCQALDVIYK